MATYQEVSNDSAKKASKIWDDALLEELGYEGLTTRVLAAAGLGIVSGLFAIAASIERESNKNG